MPNLLFCMTPGIGLSDWKYNGILGRELKTYMEYVQKGWNVKILTFDREVVPELPDTIDLVYFPNRFLLWYLPWTHKKLGDWADVIKTNQSHHAYFYTGAARHWNKPILLRCGYVHGEFLETTAGSSLKTKIYQRLEAKAFLDASHCQVPTEELSGWVIKRYGIDINKISVVPNFVDTDLFRPDSGIRKKERPVVSVGRLVSVKRFDLLIRACADIPDCTLTIIGEGPERQVLTNLAKEHGLPLNLPGNQPNEFLPRMIQEHMVFAITSEREGHPKALLEAMSAGMPCAGVRAVGIDNVIQHGENGWLVNPDKQSIADGIMKLLADRELSKKLSHNAAKYVSENYDFDSCFSKEYQLITTTMESFKH